VFSERFETMFKNSKHPKISVSTIERQNNIIGIKKRFIPTNYPNFHIESTLKKTNIKFWKAKALKFDTKCFGRKKTSAQEALEKMKQALADMTGANVTGSFYLFSVIRLFSLFSLLPGGIALASGNKWGAISPIFFIIMNIIIWV